jgi:hypothetical protein
MYYKKALNVGTGEKQIGGKKQMPCEQKEWGSWSDIIKIW